MADVAQTDALGGSGSIAPDLQALVVNGLSRAIDGALSTKYPLTSLNENYAYEGGGQFEAGAPGGRLVPRSAPQPGVAATSAAVPLFQNPVTWGIAGVLLVGVVLLLALKR